MDLWANPVNQDQSRLFAKLRLNRIKFAYLHCLPVLVAVWHATIAKFKMARNEIFESLGNVVKLQQSESLIINWNCKALASRSILDVKAFEKDSIGIVTNQAEPCICKHLCRADRLTEELEKDSMEGFWKHVFIPQI